jgi:hypothetical protein
MSLYINAENQTLLWNVIHNNPIASQYFLKLTQNEKHDWFRSIIRSFYERNINRNMSIQDLQQLNKATIVYMLQTMKQSESSIEVRQPEPTVFTKEQLFHQQLDLKKKEYDKMFEKKTPDNIDFREKFNDDIITNMSDLVQSQIREREEELRKFSQNNNILPSQTVVPIIINKTEVINSEVLNAQVLDTNQVLDTAKLLSDDNKKSKKNVSWKDESNESLLMLLEEFESFKLGVRKQLDELQEQINGLKISFVKSQM